MAQRRAQVDYASPERGWHMCRYDAVQSRVGDEVDGEAGSACAND
jgi:hypothetical protein